MTRPFTICHTSDWHLGHTLHGHSRAFEHGEFLAFLLDTLERQEVDALVVAGDVFDTANPPASAQAMLYRFFADARARMPNLDVLVTAGNHDSAARLGAADPVLRAIGVRVIGSVRRDDPGSMVVALHGADGEVAAQVAAVPFLRPSDLPRIEEGDALVEGVRALYGSVLDVARARLEPGQALLAMGHCHMVDTTPSELSERKILGGLPHALPADIFDSPTHDAEVDYVALGHLHLPQNVRDDIVYCGSPIPLSLPEESYEHQLRVVRFEEGRRARSTVVRIPRSVDVLRVPHEGPAPLADVLAALERLDVPESLPPERHPFLEVRVRVETPVPDLRQRIEDAIGARPVRLLKIGTEYVGAARALADAAPRRELTDLTVEEVFRQAYAQKYEGDPSPDLLVAFHQVAAAAKLALEEAP